MQEGIEDSVRATDASLKQVESGSVLAEQTGDALQEILSGVRAVSQQVTQIASAAQAMSAASSDLVSAMDSVSAVVEENTAAAEESAASSAEITRAIEDVAAVSEENSAAADHVDGMTEDLKAQAHQVTDAAQALSRMAADLQVALVQFKVSDAQTAQMVEMFKEAHLAWVKRLDDLFEGKVHLTEDQVASDHECALGQWYHGRGRLDFGDHPVFVAIEQPHKQMHATVRRVVAAHNRGDAATARSLSAEVRRLSAEIVSLLDNLHDTRHTTRISAAPAATPPARTPAREPVVAGNGHH